METKRTIELATNLSSLQNVVKRDPESYKTEFLSKYEECLALLDVFMGQFSSYNKNLISLVKFVSQVAQCYVKTIPEMLQFPQRLLSILSQHGAELNVDVRMTFCKALMSMRSTKVVDKPTDLFDVFIKLFACQDKILRKALYNFIVQDIKNINIKQKNMNKSLQNYMYKWMENPSPVITKMCLDIMTQLYRKRIWDDERTVNVIAKSLGSTNLKVMTAGIKFFLGADEAGEENESDDEDDASEKKTLKELELGYRVGKKSKKRLKRLDRAKTVLQKHKKKNKADPVNFSAIQLINDPHEVAEKLLAISSNTKRIEKLEVRVLAMNLVARLINIHQLILLNFYDVLLPHLRPSHDEVTKFLLFAAQASHELVPPESLEGVIKTIAMNFISDRNSEEAQAVGLNTVREICARCPLAMTKDLLDDLVEYKKSRNKGVLMAARSLITLFREKNPLMLHRSSRGKLSEAAKNTNVLEYGHTDVKDYIPGAEVLSVEEEKLESVPEDQGEWESCSEAEEEQENDSDGSWVDVHHSSDEEQDTTTVAEDSLTVEEKMEKARSVTQSRILTNDDFIKIRAQQVMKEVDTKSSKKRTHSDMTGQSNDKSGILSLGDIENTACKKGRQDYEARMTSVMAGREGREKFGRRDKRMNPHASTSNKDKQKNKAFMMVKHKIKTTKGKRTFHQKKEALKLAMMRKLKAKK